MKIVHSSDAVRAIHTLAAAEPGGAVAFDGDGTLWSGDVGEDFFQAVLGEGMAPAVDEALVREASETGLDPSGDARTLLLRIHAAYLADAFREDRICEIMTWMAAGWPLARLDAFARDLVERVAVRDRLQPEAIHIVEEARRHGLDVYVVSASPRAVVVAAAALAGIDPEHVVAVREVVVDGVVQAAVHRPIPYGPGKVTRLREKLGERPLYAAFGDNAFDVPLLRDARMPFAIRPKARLLALAGEVPGLATLARLETP